jgi:DnaJ family protein C protein 13
MASQPPPTPPHQHVPQHQPQPPEQRVPPEVSFAFVPQMTQGMQQHPQHETTSAQQTMMPPQQMVQQRLKTLTQRFRSTSGEPQGPNLGFTPTPAMIKAHQQEQSNMVPQNDVMMEQRRPLYQFQVTKLRSWRTGYVRLLVLEKELFCTYDPDSHQVTNTWSYAALTDWMATSNNEILLQAGADKLKFKCLGVHRAVVLSKLLECKVEFEKGDGPDWPIFNTCARQTRHGTLANMSMRVGPHGLQELSNGNVVQTYTYTEITAVSFTADHQSGIILHFAGGRSSRLFYIQSSRRGGNGRSDLLTLMREHYETLGLDLAIKESCTTQSWIEARRSLGIDQTLVMSWSQVSKNTRRHAGFVPRTLAISAQGNLLEVDVHGMVVSMRPLSELQALVRHSQSDQVTLEFHHSIQRTYGSSHRDALLVSLLDAAASLAQNKTVHISNVTSAGYRLSDETLVEDTTTGGGIFQPISIPLYCLKRVHAVSTAAYAFLSQSDESSTKSGEKLNVVEEAALAIQACREFTASTSPIAEGLPKSLNDKQVLGSIGALWGILSRLLKKTGDSREMHQAELAAIPILQTLYRLSQTPGGFKGTVELSTMQESIKLLWGIDDDFCQYWSLRVLLTLLSSPSRQRDMEVEYVNKSLILQTGGKEMIDGLVSTMLHAADKRPDGKHVVSDLILMVTSDILQSILCSYHDTTNPEYFSAFMEALGKGHRALLSALRSETPFVIENTALLLHLLSSHAPEIAASIRDSALSSGILLQHFHAAIFSPLEGQRFLSRFLCSLWFSGPMSCDEKRLLKRMIPSGFMGYLTMPMLSEVEVEQLDELERDGIEASNSALRVANIQNSREGSTLESTSNNIDNPTGAAGTNTSRLRARIAIASKKASTLPQHTKLENFRIFFHVLTKDHSLPDLIWNQQTRRELRIALENEIQSIKRETEARGGLENIAWNHQQFTVSYPSLDDEVKVGNVYMRLWLQAGDGFIKSWDEPQRLFEVLFRRFLCELDRNVPVTIMCIRCLERLYMFHANKIGPFLDIMILVRSMASTRSVETQHRLLALVATLLGVSSERARYEEINIPDNAEQLLNVESVGQLCQFVAWCHTNGTQVGNLLSSRLRVMENKSKMITDGSDSGPGGSGERVESIRDIPPVDRACPPVWFIAPAGKTPPPADKIRGPFRVSDLQSMLEDGELHPFDLVTASHVEDYDDDDEGGQVKEAQIDTGKWRRLEQVWQLRWQLCTDGSSSGIYSPAEVSLMALCSLTRLVDLHKSLDLRGVPYFPVPIAKRLLCGLSREPAKSKDVSVALEEKDNYLSILSQSLLCNDHKVVETAAGLLFELMQHNEGASSKFYLTGTFFFLCSYTGSNFKSLARLLHDLHLKQQFRSGFAAAANESELPMKDRSILGNMLPEGLLFVLANYGFEKFTEIFVGNYDTPEVIWNLDMRKHLVEMVRQHLGDFPQRLWQNTTTEYDYCPIPGIAYKRLEKEIFCHNYYLHNLCDESRFPDWPIAEPVELFRACLEEWKQQMSRDEGKEVDAREEARKVLELETGDGSKELRRAYRKLARQFHPDKNPAGRQRFEKIQAAYELLLPLVESGEIISASPSGDVGNGEEEKENDAEGLIGGRRQMYAVHLLLRAQLLVCKRHPDDMGKYKYPAYKMLLECMRIPPSVGSEETSDPMKCTLIKPQRAEFVMTVADLVFETCAVSPLNAEELVAEGGVAVLEKLLDFYIRVLPRIIEASVHADDQPHGVATSKVIIDIITLLVHTIAGVSYFESGRDAILHLEDASRLIVNWYRCIEGDFWGVHPSADGTVSLKKYALEGLGYMSKTEKVQKLLAGSGVVWSLIRYMLSYDPTLEQIQSGPGDEDDVQMSQAASNTYARLSARALGMLCGVLKDASLVSPENRKLYNAMSVLLTPPLARMLRNKRTGDLLRTLNSNIETPVRIWNVKMREELLKFLAKKANERPVEGMCQSLDQELENVTTSFEYTALKNEVTIGGVYLRVFNNTTGDKSSLHEIHDHSSFAKHLLNFVARSLNESKKDEDTAWKPLSEYRTTEDHPGDLEICPVDDPKFEMALKALGSIIRVDGIVDDVIFDLESHAPSIFLSLLELPQETRAFEMGCEILSVVSPKQAFADAIARQGSLWRLLRVLEHSEEEKNEKDDFNAAQSKALADRRHKGWSLLEALSSSPSIASQLIQSTGWMELMGIIAGYSGFSKTWTSRQGAAKALSRLLWDPQTGPIAGPLVQRFIPNALAIVLKEEGPDSFLKTYDGETETPELIWDSEMRGELRVELAEKLDECFAIFETESSSSRRYELPAGFRVKYKKLEDELYLGGVYVRLFLKEPTYSLRDPTTFLKSLLQRWTHELKMFTSGTGGLVIESESPDERKQDVVVVSQDKLELVTSASVYLCKVRESLCDKLAEWGYMKLSVELLRDIQALDMIGAPLLSIVRLLHVASNRMANVEMLAITGAGSGKDGIVENTMKALGSQKLHSDSAFILEMLKKVFKLALGDVEKAKQLGLDKGPPQPQYPPHQTVLPPCNPNPLALAPSPAPGEGPVRKTLADDDPLAAFRSETSISSATSGSIGNPLQATASHSNPVGDLAGFQQRVQRQVENQMQQEIKRGAESQFQKLTGWSTSTSVQNQTNVFLGQTQQSHTPFGMGFGQTPLAQQSQLSQDRLYAQTTQQQVTQKQQAPAPGSYAQRSQMLYSQDARFQQNQPQMISWGEQHPYATGALPLMSHQQNFSGGGSYSQASSSRHQPLMQPNSYNTAVSSTSTQHSGLHQQVFQPPYAFSPARPQPQVQQGHTAVPTHGPQYSHMQQVHVNAEQNQHYQQQQQLQPPNVHPSYEGQQAPNLGSALTPASHSAITLNASQYTTSTFQTQQQAVPSSIQSDPFLQSQQMATLTQQTNAPAPTPGSQGHPQQTTPPLTIQAQPHYQQGTSSFSQNQQTQEARANLATGLPQNQVLQQPISGANGQPLGPAPGSHIQPQWQQMPVHGSHIQSLTVADDAQAQPTGTPSQPIEGAGVDARTKPDPKTVAEQKIANLGGAPGAAQGRSALLQSALACSLAEYILNDVLENTSLSAVKDPASAKVHAVDLLKLLTMDPGYGMKFELILDEQPAWRKYKSQDHSLFITGAEQKADYFLTDGSSGPSKLLTEK